jgi:hypothetical protein
MKFMITFNHIDGEWEKLTPDERERHGSWLKEFMSALEAEKDTRLVFLRRVTEAKTVRRHAEGRLEVTDGPCRQLSEQPGGFYIIEAESMEEAVEWAKKGRFMVGSNEVREITDVRF